MNRLLFRIGVGVGALALLGATAGCGSEDGSTSSGGADASGSKTNIAALTLIQPPNGFVAGQICGMKQQASSSGVRLDVQGSPTIDASKQVPLLNSMITRRPKALVIDAADPQALNAPIASAIRSGIKVVGIDLLPSDTSKLSATITTDNEQGGTLAGQAMAKVLGGKGKVIDISLSPGLAGISTGAGRQSGFEKVIKANPGMTDLGVQYTGDSPVKAAQLTSAVLSKHPDLAGIYLPAPVDSAGVYNALRAAGRAGKVKVVTYDPREDQVKEMQQGNVAAFVAQDIRKEGALGVKYAQMAAQGKAVPKSTSLPNVLLYPEDLKDPVKSKYIYKSC